MLLHLGIYKVMLEIGDEFCEDSLQKKTVRIISAILTPEFGSTYATVRNFGSGSSCQHPEDSQTIETDGDN